MPSTLGVVASHRVAPFTPTGIAGLELWFDADDAAKVTHTAGDVTAWGNKGTRSTSFLHNFAADAPRWGDVTRNGRNTMNYARNDAMRLGGTFTIPHPLTIMFALKLNAKTAASHISDEGSAGRVLISGETSWLMWAGGSFVDSGVASNLNWHVLTCIFNGTSSRIRLDGTQIYGGATSPGTVAVADGWRVPGQSTTNLTLGEVLVYNTALSGSNLTNLENWSKARWAI